MFGSARTRFAIFCCLLVVLQTLVFVGKNQGNYVIVVLAVVPGLALGLVAHDFCVYTSRFERHCLVDFNRVQAAFVMFFVYLIGYILLFFVVVNYPLVWLDKLFQIGEVTSEYAYYSVNLVILLAVVSWFVWLKKGLNRSAGA
ncbi:MAG: hypothetical protein KKB30_09800 [Proteobacteria bacterium]|nr:hypothetical protein [Pseudomonadota bacterium]MBU1716848.1 hypothetical protein [Pseudomonadota bacterium]